MSAAYQHEGVLARELAIFEARRAAWLREHEHQHVLIIGDDVLGFYDLPERAYTAGLTLRGNVPMLIKQVEERDELIVMPWTLPPSPHLPTGSAP